MDAELYLGFVLATVALMLIPGPNVTLIVANSVAYGTRYGLLTLAGTSSAVVIQLALTGLGLTALLGSLAGWFEWIRWIGVAYLVCLGLMYWFAVPADLTAIGPQVRSVKTIYARGFFVSLTNPKTLLFYAAFFPQFIAPQHGMKMQIVLLSGTFLVLAVILDGLWAIFAGRVRSILVSRGRLRNRLSGSLLIGAAIGLALARNR